MLASSQRPAMEVVDLLHCIQSRDLIVELLDVDPRRGKLHYDAHALFENWNSGHQDENRKDICAYWISHLPLRLELDNDRSRDDTDALDHVSHNMNDGRSNINVAFALLLLLFYLFNLYFMFFDQ